MADEAKVDGSGAAVCESSTTTRVDTMIAETLSAVRARVQQCATKVGRPDSVRLIAVSKLKSNDHVMAAYKCGQRDFGENYVQELVEKAPALPSEIRWHFIGQLQSNKCNNLVKKVPNLACVQSVGSLKLANKLNLACENAGRESQLPVFVQVNTSAEPQKGGVAPEDCVATVKHVATKCPRLAFQGLMTIGKLGDVSAEYFERLAACRAAVCEELDMAESDVELSMGMSSDFELAIEHGATTVRVGSHIFGARPKK